MTGRNESLSLTRSHKQFSIIGVFCFVFFFFFSLRLRVKNTEEIVEETQTAYRWKIVKEPAVREDAR